MVIKEVKMISKFFNDTYSKAFSLDYISPSLQIEKEFKYNPDEICDYYPEILLNNKEKTGLYFEKIKVKTLPGDRVIFISLSGGVDSMVMLYHLKKNLGWNNIVAIHIIYNNRKESWNEFQFISDYCKRLDVPLYYYFIKYLRRSEIEREFYEKITRDIRFNVYLKVNGIVNPASKESYVLLGHIQDDIVENIWTNIARCQHLDNLKKIQEIELQMGVWICRPFLEITKNEIYEFSKRFNIPYLKNTTPEWSNRGKFRNNFYPAVISQFGEEIDKKVIQFSEMISDKDRIIEKTVYQPILKTLDLNSNVVEITRAIEVDLGLDGWSYLFERLSHYLCLSKPSIHSINNFISRLKRIEKEKLKFQMTKEYQIEIYLQNEKTFLKIK
jgi:tRNA(Ile)-lysidine synthetase-like protein